MPKHGTAYTYDWTLGQMAEVGGAVVRSLPKALKGINPKLALEAVKRGEKVEQVLDEAFGCLVGRQTVISINRSTPFNPAQFISPGWSIWKGPANGDSLSGEEDQDQHSLALTKLDLSQIQLVTCLERGETSTTGEERLNRLKKANHTRLDAKVLQTFWENQEFIPETWKNKTNGHTTYIFFEGSILRSPDGVRSVLVLCWRGGRWDWYCFWLEGDRGADDPSAVLAGS